MKNLPNDLDNQEYARRLNSAFEVLKLELDMKYWMLTYLASQPLSIESYQEARTKALFEIEKEVGANILGGNQQGLGGPNFTKRKKATGEKRKPKGYSKHETFRMIEEGKSIEEVASERGLACSTIAGHVSELITEEKLKLEDVVDSDRLEFITEMIKETGTNDFEELVEAIQSRRPGANSPGHIVRLVQRFRKT